MVTAYYANWRYLAYVKCFLLESCNLLINATIALSAIQLNYLLLDNIIYYKLASRTSKCNYSIFKKYFQHGKVYTVMIYGECVK